MNIEDIAAKVMEALKKEMNDMGHVNIMVAGKTGVGKSTLINSVFREKLADTGIGAPVTQSIKELSKPDFPLRIYDTVGLELASDRQQQVADEINSIIKNALSSGDKDKFIHCIWYCVNVNTNRFEDEEAKFIDQLAKDNTHTGVPVVVVLTIAHNKSNSKKLKDYIDDLNLNIKGVCIVLAEDYEDEDFRREAYGGEELIEYTFNLLPEAAQKAFINAQKASLKLKKRKSRYIISVTVAASFAEGFAPIPFSDAALLIPTQIGMIAGITAVYGLSVDKSMMSAIVTSLLGISGATVLGKTIVANLLKFIPGVGTAIGGMISGATASALTTALGETYIVIMEMLVKGELTESDLKTEKFTALIRDIFKSKASGKQA